jgi:hypothetical protein
VIKLLKASEILIANLLYIGDFARQKLYFRRVRIPPLLHVYWDSLFINHGVRKVMRHFVGDPDKALQSGEQAALLFPRMITLAQQAALPTDDIEHMRDFFNLLQLARRYYFLPFSEEISAEITAAKKAYKQRWPRDSRARYRVKISFVPFPIKHRSLAFAARVLLRRNAATASSTACSFSIFPASPTAPSAHATPPPSQNSSANPPWASTSFSNNIPHAPDYSGGRTNNRSCPECDSSRHEHSSGYEMPL